MDPVRDISTFRILPLHVSKMPTDFLSTSSKYQRLSMSMDKYGGDMGDLVHRRGLS